jgi:hypothetical protein
MYKLSKTMKEHSSLNKNYNKVNFLSMIKEYFYTSKQIQNINYQQYSLVYLINFSFLTRNYETT